VPPSPERAEQRDTAPSPRPASAPPPGPAPLGYLTPNPARPPAPHNGGGAAFGRRVNGGAPKPSRRRDERSAIEQLRDGIEELWWEVSDPDRRRLVVGIAAALGLLFIAAAYWYFAQLPEQLADDYRERAQPAAERVADSMDEVYAAFDNYLDESDPSPSRLRNAQDFEEFRRRMLPIYDDYESAIRRAESATTAARGVIGQSQADLGRVPSELFLGATEPIGDVEEARTLSGEYIVAAAAYLEDFEEFLAYERKGLDLAREALRDTPSIATLDSADLGSLRDALEADLRDARRLRRAVLRIEPPADMERSHELVVESLTVNVDFFDDLVSAIRNHDQAAYVDAIEDHAVARYRVERQQARARAAFESNSGLQDDSIRLTEMANELEAAIAALGSGTTDDVKPRSRKRPAGPPPAHGRTGEDESQTL
jgi:hypothetical protein